MVTKLIKLNDGTLVEVQIAEQEAELVSGFTERVAETVGATFDKVQPLLLNIIRPLKNTWNELNQEMQIEQAEIELGLSFEGEGNLYVTKSKAGANLTIKLVLKPEKMREK